MPKSDHQADEGDTQADQEIDARQTLVVQYVAQKGRGDDHDGGHHQRPVQREQDGIGRLPLDDVHHLQGDKNRHEERAGKAQAKAPHQQFLAGQIATTLPGPSDYQERPPEDGRQAKPDQVVLHWARAAGKLSQHLQEKVQDLAHLVPPDPAESDEPVQVTRTPVCLHNENPTANRPRQSTQVCPAGCGPLVLIMLPPWFYVPA
ncbi:MAG: hypothetical protein GWN58_54980 [Anaerolineae bacterium]|nr:hypothetical protein [Anaerolineae bacterium]